MFLLKGILESPTKLLIDTIYNIELQENANIDQTDGVLVEKIMTLSDFGIIPQRGKGYIHYVNPQTNEQWYEEYDRALTLEEQIEVQNEKIDLLIMNQLEMEGIL